MGLYIVPLWHGEVLRPAHVALMGRKGVPFVEPVSVFAGGVCWKLQRTDTPTPCWVTECVLIRLTSEQQKQLQEDQFVNLEEGLSLQQDLSSEEADMLNLSFDLGVTN